MESVLVTGLALMGRCVLGKVFMALGLLVSSLIVYLGVVQEPESPEGGLTEQLFLPVALWGQVRWGGASE